MTYLRLLLLVVIWPICAMPVQAQLFRKKAPATPAPQRVPELVLMLKTDGDERKRAAAAEELREFDVKTYTEIVPVLLDAARNDASVNVRLEALTSLGKIRPISREAGQIIEHAAAEDANLRVRLHARTTLWKYQLAGYSSAAGSGTKKTTEEPPLLEPPAKDAVKPGTLGPPVPTKRETAKSPAGKATTIKADSPRVETPRPLPTPATTFSTAVPQKPKVRPSHGPTIVENEVAPPPPLREAPAPAPTVAPLPAAAPPLPEGPVLGPPILPATPPVVTPPAVTPPTLPEASSVTPPALPEAPPLRLPKS